MCSTFPLTIGRKPLPLSDNKDPEESKTQDTLEDGEIRESDTESEDSLNEQPKNYYEPKKSFFDNISCEANDPKGERLPRHQERKLNAETFGIPERTHHHNRRYHGGYRGGQGNRRGGQNGMGPRPMGSSGQSGNRGYGDRGNNNNNNNRGYNSNQNQSLQNSNRGYYPNNSNNNMSSNPPNGQRTHNNSGPRMAHQNNKPIGYSQAAMGGNRGQANNGYMPRSGGSSMGMNGGLGYGSSRGYNKVR